MIRLVVLAYLPAFLLMALIVLALILMAAQGWRIEILGPTTLPTPTPGVLQAG